MKTLSPEQRAEIDRLTIQVANGDEVTERMLKNFCRHLDNWYIYLDMLMKLHKKGIYGRKVIELFAASHGDADRFWAALA